MVENALFRVRDDADTPTRAQKPKTDDRWIPRDQPCSCKENGVYRIEYSSYRRVLPDVTLFDLAEFVEGSHHFEVVLSRVCPPGFVKPG